MRKLNLKPEDSCDLTIELKGALGADFVSVAGRETVREKMIEAATRQIDAWMESIAVKEPK